MFFKKKEDVAVEKFWQDYEASIGEKVLARSLGQFISGWAEYNYPIWGLVIATSGGFRFHHFAHEGWLMALSRAASGGEGPKEKKFFIPRVAIQSAELVTENRWWKKIFASSNPALVIRYGINCEEAKIVVEVDRNAKAVVEALQPTSANAIQ